MTTSLSQFEVCLKQCDTEIAYSPEWANGTGYLDGFVRDAEATSSVAFGGRVKFTDDKGRRAIGIKTRVGNVVLFERYSEDAQGNRPDVIVINAPSILGIPTGRQSPETIFALAGGFDFQSNIGKIIEAGYKLGAAGIESDFDEQF